jgi:UDP-2,4-diacetamido-2,4,6-trideoxy-beta-L-altropyranose hydrolase
VNVVFRADASYKIGAGHLIRCLTLADALGYRGAQCCFVCRKVPPALGERIRSQGHELIELAPAPDGDWDTGTQSGWLESTQEEDARQTRNALLGRRCNWLIVDHYGLDFRWERELREVAPAILVIDDLADRRHDCDLLLDQNYYADLTVRYENLLNTHTRCLLGPEYALLRPEFSVARTNAEIPPSNRLFVSMGANDPFRICMKVMESLQRLIPESLGADIVMGTDTIAQNEAAAFANELPGVVVHGFVNRIADIMARCTIAVGAAGSSTWERCAMGLPSIVYVTADNQRKMAVDLARTGVITLLGEAANASIDSLADAIADLQHQPARRSRMRSDAMKLVDGQGAYRVADKIGEFERCTN